jgi:hypothetical protein
MNTDQTRHFQDSSACNVPRHGIQLHANSLLEYIRFFCRVSNQDVDIREMPSNPNPAWAKASYQWVEVQKIWEGANST